MFYSMVEHLLEFCNLRGFQLDRDKVARLNALLTSVGQRPLYDRL